MERTYLPSTSNNILFSDIFGHFKEWIKYNYNKSNDVGKLSFFTKLRELETKGYNTHMYQKKHYLKCVVRDENNDDFFPIKKSIVDIKFTVEKNISESAQKEIYEICNKFCFKISNKLNITNDINIAYETNNINIDESCFENKFPIKENNTNKFPTKENNTNKFQTKENNTNKFPTKENNTNKFPTKENKLPFKENKTNKLQVKENDINKFLTKENNTNKLPVNENNINQPSVINMIDQFKPTPEIYNDRDKYRMKTNDSSNDELNKLIDQTTNKTSLIHQKEKEKTPKNLPFVEKNPEIDRTGEKFGVINCGGKFDAYAYESQLNVKEVINDK
jgi:hypothetical protein